MRYFSLTVCLLVLVSGLGCGSDRPRVVLYCAQDQEFAEQVLADFSRQTGLRTAPRFDTEANKTVALYEELVREQQRPRCDVYWNNEILHTVRLQRQGLLEPYASPSAEAYPEHTRPRDRTYQQFAARARVILINTARVADADRPHSLLDLTGPRWRGKVAMAKPMFGTTATQAACLFEVLGPAKAREFYRGLKANDVALLPGNKQVAERVARGDFDAGLTDTDDALLEVEAGRPVALLFPDRAANAAFPRLGTLFIPNTLAIVRGGPNPAAARRLVDFLLSAAVEEQLARSASRQIPLNPRVRHRPHAQIETPATVRAMQVDWDRAVDLWQEAQDFLRGEFGGP